MSMFKDNDLLTELYVDDESTFKVGEYGCTSINTVMENGQMVGVPWFEVFINDELSSKWNGAKILGVKV